jgi:hypothetical protein
MEDNVTSLEERRRYQRLSLHSELQIRRVKETTKSTSVHNLCPAGCCVDTAVDLTEGERAWVRLPGLQSIPSTVRWAKEWMAGVSFDRPVHPAVFEMVIRRMR